MGASLAGDHKVPPEWEIKQLAAILLNWLEKRDDDRAALPMAPVEMGGECSGNGGCSCEADRSEETDAMLDCEGTVYRVAMTTHELREAGVRRLTKCKHFTVVYGILGKKCRMSAYARHIGRASLFVL